MGRVGLWTPKCVPKWRLTNATIVWSLDCSLICCWGSTFLGVTQPARPLIHTNVPALSVDVHELPGLSLIHHKNLRNESMDIELIDPCKGFYTPEQLSEFSNCQGRWPYSAEFANENRRGWVGKRGRISQRVEQEQWWVWGNTSCTVWKYHNESHSYA